AASPPVWRGLVSGSVSTWGLLGGCAGIMVGVPDLIVVTGPPGAGKTTVATALSRRFKPSAVVAGDQFLAFIGQGYLAPWTAAAHHQSQVVIEAAAAAAGRLASGGYTVVYDGVLGPWFLGTFAAATGVAFVHYAILLPPEQVCLQRVRCRADHGFRDLAAAGHMHQQFAKADIDPKHVLASTGDARALASRLFHLVAAEVLRWPAPGPGVPPRRPAGPEINAARPASTRIPSRKSGSTRYPARPPWSGVVPSVRQKACERSLPVKSRASCAPPASEPACAAPGPRRCSPPVGGADRPAGHRAPDQPGDRRPAVHQRHHRRVPPAQDLPQA